MWLQFVAVKKTSEPHLGLSLADREGYTAGPAQGSPLTSCCSSAPKLLCVTEKGMVCVCSLQAPSHGLAGFDLCLNVSLCLSVTGLS